ncbi:MAG TPA: hypothetical protein VFT64_10540 [Rickettsiales bacterium]|nr:hypothetical protein [Rickettsiales bacterium]
MSTDEDDDLYENTVEGYHEFKPGQYNAAAPPDVGFDFSAMAEHLIDQGLFAEHADAKAYNAAREERWRAEGPIDPTDAVWMPEKLLQRAYTLGKMTVEREGYDIPEEVRLRFFNNYKKAAKLIMAGAEEYVQKRYEAGTILNSPYVRGLIPGYDISVNADVDDRLSFDTKSPDRKRHDSQPYTSTEILAGMEFGRVNPGLALAIPAYQAVIMDYLIELGREFQKRGLEAEDTRITVSDLSHYDNFATSVWEQTIFTSAFLPGMVVALGKDTAMQREPVDEALLTENFFYKTAAFPAQNGSFRRQTDLRPLYTYDDDTGRQEEPLYSKRQGKRTVEPVYTRYGGSHYLADATNVKPFNCPLVSVVQGQAGGRGQAWVDAVTRRQGSEGGSKEHEAYGAMLKKIYSEISTRLAAGDEVVTAYTNEVARRIEDKLPKLRQEYIQKQQSYEIGNRAVAAIENTLLTGEESHFVACGAAYRVNQDSVHALVNRSDRLSARHLNSDLYWGEASDENVNQWLAQAIGEAYKQEHAVVFMRDGEVWRIEPRAVQSFFEASKAELPNHEQLHEVAPYSPEKPTLELLNMAEQPPPFRSLPPTQPHRAVGLTRRQMEEGMGR